MLPRSCSPCNVLHSHSYYPCALCAHKTKQKKIFCCLHAWFIVHLRVRFTQAEILSSQIRELPEFQCAAFGFHYTTPYPSQHDTCGRLHVHGSSKV